MIFLKKFWEYLFGVLAGIAALFFLFSGARNRSEKIMTAITDNSKKAEKEINQIKQEKKIKIENAITQHKKELKAINRKNKQSKEENKDKHKLLSKINELQRRL